MFKFASFKRCLSLIRILVIYIYSPQEIANKYKIKD